jgi:histidyl-tRNA synthetase
VGERAEAESLRIAEQLRDGSPTVRVQVNLGGGNFKAQFRRADKSGAQWAVIIGDNEIERGVAAIKALRGRDGQTSQQTECSLNELPQLGAKLWTNI